MEYQKLLNIRINAIIKCGIWHKANKGNLTPKMFKKALLTFDKPMWKTMKYANTNNFSEAMRKTFPINSKARGESWERYFRRLIKVDTSKVYKRENHIKIRTPIWANKDAIKFFYECRPEGCHVDHIIPLRGKLINGLHIETNLQWMPATKNLSKGNKYG